MRTAYVTQGTLSVSNLDPHTTYTVYGRQNKDEIRVQGAR
jgi:hypothetical protein